MADTLAGESGGVHEKSEFRGPHRRIIPRLTEEVHVRQILLAAALAVAFAPAAVAKDDPTYTLTVTASGL